MAKNEFKDLESTLRETLDNMSEAELRAKMSEVALLSQAVRDEMAKDPEVKQARERLKNELSEYRSDIKGAGLQMKYIKKRLQDMGKL